jgi:hypothetical protein
LDEELQLNLYGIKTGVHFHGDRPHYIIIDTFTGSKLKEYDYSDEGRILMMEYINSVIVTSRTPKTPWYKKLFQKKEPKARRWTPI